MTRRIRTLFGPTESIARASHGADAASARGDSPVTACDCNFVLHGVSVPDRGASAAKRSAEFRS